MWLPGKGSDSFKNLVVVVDVVLVVVEEEKVEVLGVVTVGVSSSEMSSFASRLALIFKVFSGWGEAMSSAKVFGRSLIPG